MIFSLNGSLIDYRFSNDDFDSNTVKKVVASCDGNLQYGYISPIENYFSKRYIKNFELLKIFKEKQYSDKYLNMYKFISDKYLFPLADLYDIFFDFKTVKNSSTKIDDFCIKFDVADLLENSFKKYQDMVDFILQSEAPKYSDLLKRFSKRKVDNFLLKTKHEKLQVSLKNLNYLPMDKLLNKISKISDSKIRLFIFPTISLKNEFYNELSSKIYVFKENSLADISKFDESKFNLYFGSPLTLLVPFEWDDIVIVDSDSDFYKLSYPPYFDTLEVIKEFFPNSTLHYRSLNFKMKTFFNINGNPNYKSTITFKKLDNSILDIVKKSVFEGDRILLLTKHNAYASKIKCTNCGSVQRCPNCSRSLSYYSDKDLYICNNCGFASKNLKCQECGWNNFEYFSFGSEYFKNKFNYLSEEIFIFDKNTESLPNLTSRFVISNVSILNHIIVKLFDMVLIYNIDDFVFMDYRARDRLLNLLIKLQSITVDNGKIIALYKSNIFNLNFPLNLKYYYDIEETERKSFKFPPYYNIVYVVFDTSRLKFDYLFAKLMSFLRQYCNEDFELFGREDFGRGILTIKIKDKDLPFLKIFFEDYKEANIYVNVGRDVQ